jgi:hypothetical protein
MKGALGLVFDRLVHVREGVVCCVAEVAVGANILSPFWFWGGIGGRGFMRSGGGRGHFFLLGVICKRVGMLPYDFYSQSAPGLASDQGDVSLSFGCGRPWARTQSMQKFIPQVNRTCVSDLFFSEENIAALQHGIRYSVYKSSHGSIVIGNQSRDELSIIMRSLYLTEGVNLPFNILEQVRALNGKVLDFCTPRVFAEAKASQKYLHDISNQPIPMAPGLYTTRAGLRGGGN